jgi:hypothetical protein
MYNPPKLKSNFVMSKSPSPISTHLSPSFITSAPTAVTITSGTDQQQQWFTHCLSTLYLFNEIYSVQDTSKSEDVYQQIPKHDYTGNTLKCTSDTTTPDDVYGETVTLAEYVCDRLMEVLNGMYRTHWK